LIVVAQLGAGVAGTESQKGCICSRHTSY
jgi:hypothetical protein